MFRFLGYSSLSLLVLLSAYSSAQSRMESIAISPDGKFVAVTYKRNHTSFIYKVAVETGAAVRLD